VPFEDETPMSRDPRTDPQEGDEIRIGSADGELRKIIGRDDDVVRCLDGVMRYRIKLKKWQRWCLENDVVVTKVADQEL
jgi:hypothetical protein